MRVGNNICTYEYKMRAHSLEEVQVEKDLGVLISSDLKVSPQCIGACARASRVLGMINRTIVNKTTEAYGTALQITGSTPPGVLFIGLVTPLPKRQGTHRACAAPI